MHLLYKFLLMNLLKHVTFFNAQKTTHLELKPASMLSAVASLTPFSDHNQSPRNMYQCQVSETEIV